MKSIDLHVHSTYSDGTLTPSELVKKAFSINLAAMALTDHDTIDGIPEAVSCAADYDIELIPGIELSTFYDKKEIHIVGLYIDYTDKNFKKELESLKQSREKRNEKILGDSKPCYVPREKMLPEKAIKMIKSVGGVPVLAHPVLYHMGNEQMNKLMDYLCEHGIAGLEAVYSTYTMGDELEMKHIAKERNLLISGGSDYHGANKPDIELGTGRGHLFVPEEILTKIKEYKNNI